jgi:hypothetical protein
MSQPPNEEHRKFVLVFTGPAHGRPVLPEAISSAPVEIIVTAWVLMMMDKYGWKSEMSLNLPLSARVEIKEADEQEKAQK